jgi:hypothetical protein
MSETVASAIAFSGRVAPFDAAAIAVSALLILLLMTRLVVESAWGPQAVPGYARAATGALLVLFAVCAVSRLILVAMGVY